MSKDKELLNDLVDSLEGDDFHNLVAKKVAEQRGVPLTEALRREIVADLRNNSSVTVGPTSRPH